MPTRWGPVLDLAVARGLINGETGERLRRLIRPEVPIAEFVQITGLPEVLVRGIVREAEPPGSKAHDAASAPAALAEALLTPTVSPDAPPIIVSRSPDHVGRYPILGLLGRGAMGAVYRAYDPSLHRAIALKTMSGAATEEDPEMAQKRFVREAQAVAKLRHPGIVCVHEQGSDDGILYFTMDLVEGKSFSQALRDGTLSGSPRATRPPSPSAPTVAQSPSGATPASPESSRLPLRKAVEVLAQVGAAIGYAHAQGIVHRDFKPANILLDRQGKAYVSDFGLAKDSKASLELTKSQAMMGTAYYMSPEQCAGRSREVTPASDVFALGVILFEAMTGSRPFTGDSAPEILTKILSVEPTRPRRLNPGIPPDLETVCLKALQKSPAQRYPTGKEFAADLQRHLTGKRVRARPSLRAARILRELRKVPWAVWGLLVALLLTVIVLPIFFKDAGKSQQPASGTGADASAMSYEKIVATIHPETGRDWLIVSDMCSKYRFDKAAEEAIEKAFKMNPDDGEIAARYKGLIESKLAGINIQDKDLIESKLQALNPRDDDYPEKLFQVGEEAEKLGMTKFAEDIYVSIAGDGVKKGICPKHPGANRKLGRVLTPWGDYEDAELVASLAQKVNDSEKERMMLAGMTPWQRSAYNKKKDIEKTGLKCVCVSEQPYLIVVQESPAYAADLIAEEFRRAAEHLYRCFRSEYANKLTLTDIFEGPAAEEVLPIIVYDSKNTYLEKNPGIPEWAGGHYSPQDGTIQMFRDTETPYATVFHEGTHQLVGAATRLKGGKDTNMFWFSEGIATFFEDFKRDQNGDFVIGIKSRRYLPEIQQFFKAKKQVPLKDLIGKSYMQFRIEQSQLDTFKQKLYVDLHYAESWSLLYFLSTYENGKYGDKFDEYFLKEISGQGGPDTFKSIFGDPDVIEQEWLDYIGSLKLD